MRPKIFMSWTIEGSVLIVTDEAVVSMLKRDLMDKPLSVKQEDLKVQFLNGLKKTFPGI